VLKSINSLIYGADVYFYKGIYSNKAAFIAHANIYALKLISRWMDVIAE